MKPISMLNINVDDFEGMKVNSKLEDYVKEQIFSVILSNEKFDESNFPLKVLQVNYFGSSYYIKMDKKSIIEYIDKVKQDCDALEKYEKSAELVKLKEKYK